MTKERHTSERRVGGKVTFIQARALTSWSELLHGVRQQQQQANAGMFRVLYAGKPEHMEAWGPWGMWSEIDWLVISKPLGLHSVGNQEPECLLKVI